MTSKRWRKCTKYKEFLVKEVKALYLEVLKLKLAKLEQLSTSDERGITGGKMQVQLVVVFKLN